MKRITYSRNNAEPSVQNCFLYKVVQGSLFLDEILGLSNAWCVGEESKCERVLSLGRFFSDENGLLFLRHFDLLRLCCISTGNGSSNSPL